jgi:hypothetical protein
MRNKAHNKARSNEIIIADKPDFVTRGDLVFRSKGVPFRTVNPWAISLVMAPLFAGCASHQIGPNRPVPIETDVAMVSSLAYPQDLATFASNWPDKGAARNEMLTARMYVSDMEYQAYEANLTKEMQDEGLLGTATVLGLTTSSTLVGAAATKTILSGIATGVAGLDKAYNEKELLSNAMQALQTQMRADRNAQAAQIYARMFTTDKKPTPISQYTWTMALSDAEAYYQAGTLTSALVGLSKTTAKAAENAAVARAVAGPNAPQVTAAQENASPTAVAVPPSRAPFVAPIPSPHGKTLPIPPRPPANQGAINSFEKFNLPPETIGEFEGTLCAKQDKSIPSLREGMVAFFNSGGDDDIARASRISKQGILPVDLAVLEQVHAVNPSCKTKLDGPAAVGAQFFNKPGK